MNKPMKCMKQLLATITILICTIAHAESIELKLKDGTLWVGDIGQIITVQYEDNGKKTNYEGEITRATKSYIIVADEFLFIDKIISISGSEKEMPALQVTTSDSSSVSSSNSTDTSASIKTVKEGDLPRGVFVLPLVGSVGTYFRDTEITRLIDHVEEKYGLGQIIILEIDSGGGAVHIWNKIRQVIMEARERHRFIAWIKSAGSGAAATAYVCDEIYYKPRGYVGAITMYGGGNIENPSPDWQMDGWVRELESVLARSSHTPMVAGCMVRSKYNFSYDIDPETGEFTYYDHEHGDHVLSESGENFMSTPKEALRAGLSDGTAHTGEELAPLLDLDEWIEIDSFGRDIAADWKETLDEFEIEFPKLYRKFRGDVQATTPKKALSARIKAGIEIISWHKRLGEDTWEMKIGPKLKMWGPQALEYFKREVTNLKHQQRNIDE